MMELLYFMIVHPSQVVAIFVIVYLIFGIGFTIGLFSLDFQMETDPRRYSLEWWAMGLLTVIFWPYAMWELMRN